MYAVAINPSKMETSMKKVLSSFTVPFGKIAYNIQKILPSIFGDNIVVVRKLKISRICK
jgi:hypothetical protein